MESLAQIERELIAERTRVGLEAVRSLGCKGGCRPKMTPSKVESAKKLLDSSLPSRNMARNLGASVLTLYRWIPASSHLWRIFSSHFSGDPKKIAPNVGIRRYYQTNYLLTEVARAENLLSAAPRIVLRHSMRCRHNQN
ncbi:hypothetical protein [Synechococcus elongatus]|uniref:hypothetical protein n=1 Tax=Synechococcus elongatus TaxID=32046 RepID=UPI003BF80F0C